MRVCGFHIPLAAALVTVGLALGVTPAAALPNDSHLAGLIVDGDPDEAAFREMAIDLGLVMTPSPMQPAETTGQAGFDFALDYTGTPMTGYLNAAANGDDQLREHWGSRALSGAIEDGGHTPGYFQTIGLRGRKGFIFPLPLTSEIELGAQWLVQSQLLNIGGNLRLALNEGFRWVPDVAVMTGINRLVGSGELDLTTVTAGGSISKGFGIFGDINLAPWIAYQSIFIHGLSRLVDPDPLNTSDINNNESFRGAPVVSLTNNDGAQCAADVFNCVRLTRYDRISGGLRLTVALVQIAVGLDVNVLPDREFPVVFQGTTRFGLYF